MHVFHTRIFDRHAFASSFATSELIREINKIKPDAIGLHNLHGYYINIKILFDYLKKVKIPVIWTLFDCWAFTGHCSYFDDINCQKWIKGCYECPKKMNYPSSWFWDNSKMNFIEKKEIFASLENMHLVVHSSWLNNLVKNSFLSAYPVYHIPSAVDLSVFKPIDSGLRKAHGLKGKKIILGCTNIWSERKGLTDFLNLNKHLDDSFQIVLIGVTEKQRKNLPRNIIGFSRTESVQELAQWYSAADVFVNPTYQDNFPTTNLESLACGTPVITYDTGGSPEAVDEHTGKIVPKGNKQGLVDAVKYMCLIKKDAISKVCRQRAQTFYDKEIRFTQYLRLYENLVK